MKSILDLDATTLAQQIRSGSISSVDATQTYINHIKKVNPYINAMAEDRFEEALKEAEEKDRLRKQGKAQGRLFGVPISVKESFFVKGMKTTSGLVNRKEAVDMEDAEVVRRLKNEGAVILGKTNTPSLLLAHETDNLVYGRTNNPWDLSRTSGGSSGGEGALIAVGGAAVGIGSDIGGSIRVPSHCNGVIGFKSGKNQVSDEGHFPPFLPSIRSGMQGIGALSKSVNDAQLIYEITANHPLEKQKLKEFSFTVPDPDPSFPMQPFTAHWVKQVREYLQTQFPVSKDLPPYFHQAAYWWWDIISIGRGKDWILHLDKKQIGIFGDFLQAKLGFRHNIDPYLATAVISAKVLGANEKKLDQRVNEVKSAEREVKQFLHKRILIFPVYCRSAPKHGELFGQITKNKKSLAKYASYIVYANVFGLPALVIPVGEDELGLPIAVQLITSVGQEHALFEAGRILEEKFRGYIRCKKYDNGYISKEMIV